MYGYEYLKKFLEEQNFKYDDEERMYIYNYHGVKYIGWKNEGPFLQLCIVFFNVNDDNRDKCLRICNDLNCKCFVVKTTVVEDSIWCSYEFMPNEAFPLDEFVQIMQLLDRVSDEFLEKFQEENKEGVEN